MAEQMRRVRIKAGLSGARASIVDSMTREPLTDITRIEITMDARGITRAALHRGEMVLVDELDVEALAQ